MKPVKLSIEIEQQICKDYLEKIPVRKIAIKNSVSVATVNNVRIRNNLTNRRVAFTEQDKLEILDLYKEVRNITEIKRRTKLDRTTISNILQEFIPKEELKSQHYINRTKVKTNRFLNINDEKTSYFLGLLAADGCVDDRDSISLGLTDECLIKEYVSFLQADVKVHSYKNPKHPNARPIFSTKFVNREVAATLTSYGITPRKSSTLKINFKLNFSFLRGYIDGNGNIKQESKNSIGVTIVTASKDFMNQVVEFLHNYGITTKVYGHNSIFMIRIGKKKQLLRLYSYLYEKATVYLERKRKKFDIIR